MQLLVTDAAPGYDAVFVADLFDYRDRECTISVQHGLEKLGSSPAEVLSSLGVTHLLLVNRHRRGPDRNLLRELVAGREPLFEVDPSGGGRLGEARLPMEMEFAATAIWRVERAGPWAALYEL